MSVKIALGQMRVEPEDCSGNLAHAARTVERAAGGGARIVVLPECLDVGWGHPCARQMSGAIPGGAACSELAIAAAKHGVYVCAGIAERSGTSIFNSAVLLGPDGTLLLHHRKLNELEIAHELYAQGDRLGVVRTDVGTLGVMICADATAHGHVVSRTLGYMGADIILSPAAWAVPPDHDPVKEPYGQMWRDAYGPVCRDFRLWIVGVSNVGPVTAGAWAGWKCIGCSLVVGPDGQPVVTGPYGEDAEALLFVEVETVARPARGNGWFSVWGSDERDANERARAR